MTDQKKTRKTPERHKYKYDPVIKAVRKTGLPLNRTTLREYAVQVLIDGYTDPDTKEIDIGGLSIELRELRGLKKAQAVENITLE